MKYLFLASLHLLFFISSKAQSVAINTDGSTANASALLDVKSINKGMLTPRMSAAQRIAITTPANGLMVYDTDSSTFSYYNGSSWVFITAGNNKSASWGLKGNSGTNPSINFIGTIDDNDLVFKRNNSLSGKVGVFNTSFGIEALNANTVGVRNTAFGLKTLSNYSSGSDNTAIGNEALNSNINGNDNTAIGSYSISGENTSSNVGKYNTAIGSNSLRNNNSGQYNVAIGYKSMMNSKNNFDPVWGYGGNVAVGSETMTNGGIRNVAIGTLALRLNYDTAKDNTAVGYAALTFNRFGRRNTAVGSRTLYNYDGTDDNTAIGYEALQANSGSDNTAIGSNALSGADLNTDIGKYNTAIGSNALRYNNIGRNNVAIGYKSMYISQDNFNVSTASYEGSVGIGYETLLNCGPRNVAIGTSALRSFNNTTLDNTAIGYSALTNNQFGISNTAIGSKSLNNNLYGSNNIAIGKDAGLNLTSGDNNIFIGSNVQPNISNIDSYQLNIGNWIYGYNGNIGIGMSNPVEKLEINGKIKIVDGSQGTGKVLTSDASGISTWQTPISLTTWQSTGNDINNINTGNVGIGTTTPSNYGHGGTNKFLEINNSQTTTNAQSHLILSSNASATNLGSIGGITWVANNGNFIDKRMAFIGSNSSVYGGDLRFWTSNNGILLQQMRLESDGKFRIEGVNFPSTNTNSLSIGGNGHVGVDAPGIVNGRFVILENGNTGIGTPAPTDLLSVNGTASKPGGGSWATFSDIRTKTNVTKFEDGLNIIKQLSPITFNYNEKSGYTDLNKTYIGFSAQDVEKIAPYMVQKIDDSKNSGLSDKRTLDESALTKLLINAVKEQQVLIEHQQKQINLLLQKLK